MKNKKIKIPVHTPGPWGYDDNNGCKDIYAERTNEKLAVCFTTGVSNDPTDLANARLIAAAPDLLNALQKLIKWAALKDINSSKLLKDECIWVIKKAIGENPELLKP